jgi:uncharacterized membrane protein YdjX (TVP38/TMEM64 family)
MPKWGKWALIAAVLLGLFFVRQQIPLADWIQSFNQWVSTLGLAGIGVFAAVYALAAVLFLPGSVLTVGAGFVFGVFWGTVAVSIGSTGGAAAAFLIARYVARERIQHKAEGNSRFHAVDRAVAREGWKIVGLLRLSPAIPYNLSNYLYGLTGVRFWPYLIASWLGMIPGTVMYVYLGAVGKAGVQAAAGQGRARTPEETALLVVGLLATVGVTVFVTRIARNALKDADVSNDNPESAGG